MKRPPKADSEQNQTPREPAGNRAREWGELLTSGVYPSRAALARAMGVSRAAVTQALGPKVKGR